jgi:hypothetical protein
MRYVSSNQLPRRRISWKPAPLESNVPSSNSPEPKRLKPQQLEERRETCLCFNCDTKYSKGHKCGEKKLFYIDCEEEEVDDQEPSQDEET